MKKFIRNIVLFLMPVLLYYSVWEIPFYFAGVITKEISDVDECISFQRKTPDSLFGLGYSDPTQYYKLANANYFQAPVIALGTSRVMQFKSLYFNDCFYNCGGAVGGNYLEYKNFIENLSYKPEVIILGLDAWVFNDNWNSQIGDTTSFFEIVKPTFKKKTIMMKIREDYKIKWTFWDLNSFTNNIGFNGIIKESGFLIDGSYYYGNVYRYPENQLDYKFTDTLNRIETGRSRFEWGNHIDPETLIQLEILLAYCKDNEIQVVGFLAPFAPTVYKAMEDSNNYEYLKEITPSCRELFFRYGFSFFDYMNPIQLKVTDDYFLDGFHGSDVVYGYIIEDFIEKNPYLQTGGESHVFTPFFAEHLPIFQYFMSTNGDFYEISDLLIPVIRFR